MVQADPSRSIVRRQVQSVEFGFYTDDHVRTRSVCEVTSPQALDPLGTPLPSGLYDPKMGPTSATSPPCITCGCLFQNCSGHAGHVELCVPVYHPLLFSRLHTLLKIKCLNCHKIRLGPRQADIAKTKFSLIERGRIKEAEELEEELARALYQARKEEGNEEKRKPSAHAQAAAVDQVLREKRSTMSPSTTIHETSVERRLKRELIKHVVSSCMKSRKCEHCGAFSPMIRQDASNKIFQASLSAQHSRVNLAEGIKLESALTYNAASKDGYDSDDTQKSNGDEALEEEEQAPEDAEGDKFMHALEVEAQVKLTWLMDPFLCHCLFGGGKDSGWQIFFLRAIPVPPSRFRPPMVMGIMTVEHAQNHYLSKMLTSNDRVRTLLGASGEEEEKAHSMAITTWIDLQTTINCYMDSSKDPSATAAYGNAPAGIRQILEKKEGIFRKHMMGKRVDYACRSVISPDPYVGTNEIGIPLHFAKTLTYPTPVTGVNITELRTLVCRGKAQYPGASWVEFPDGRRVDLGKMDAHKRQAVAARMLALSRDSSPPVIVGRQLRNGDMMLVNRQPTLHKPGIMAHYVRILHNPTQKTIRMHYANCNTYNADFDGDEMNCHFPQNDVARAESEFIAATDLQFIVPTDGSPLRGLIQDHVDAGVKLTCKDTFIEKWEYQQLLFTALASLPGLEVIRSDMDIELVPPAIRKPRELWTGKQVITTLLHHLRKGNDRDALGHEQALDLPGICMERKSKTPETAFGGNQQEHLVLFRDGELLRGVLDKGAFGDADYSLVHAVYEAYGPNKAGLLLNALGRLFTGYLQYFSGHSCRMEDLVLTSESDKTRRDLVERAYNMGSRAAKAWADSEGGKVQIETVKDQPEADKPLKPHEAATASAKIGQLLSGSEGQANFAALDGYMQSQLNPLASEIIKACLPNGLAVPFPANTFGLMVTTGAKGSTVNQSQVSCSLGQQALEGRRVPRMSSGRTLPSFAPYDPNPRADGFIADRFLTGVRPQEYYFHCMAGREGLVDTAVKTSRSGYLQRCLVKHLEELKVCYDSTVRDGEGGVVQFLYGEDGLDPTKAAYLDCTSRTFEYIARNHEALERRNKALPNATLDAAARDADRIYAIKHNAPGLLEKGSYVFARKLRVGSRWVRGALCRGWFSGVITKNHDGKVFDLMYLEDKTHAKGVPLEVDLGRCGGKFTPAISSLCTLIQPAVPDPVLTDTGRDNGKYRVGSSGACISERVAVAAKQALHKDVNVKSALKCTGMSQKEFSKLIAAMYGTALCSPGEAVGSIAAQSVGEPSTQMTLNTFHLAGSGANVTLGIPRLREIIMTATKELKTPTMSVPLTSGVSEKEALKLTRFFSSLTLMEVLSSHGGITVNESLMQGDGGNWERAYQVTLKLQPAERIMEAFGLRLQDIASVVARSFMPKLSDIMKREMRRSAASGDVASFEVQGGAASEFIDSSVGKGRSSTKGAEIEEESEDEDAGEEVGAEEGVMGSRFSHKREMESYGDMDDDDKAVAMQKTKESQMFEEESNTDDHGGSDEAAVVSDDEDHAAFTAFDEFGNSVKVNTRLNSLVLQPLRVDPSARPLLMVGLVERAASATLVRSRPKIFEAFVNVEEERGRCLQTAGVNFEEFWKLDNVNHNQLASNDIWAVRCAYGVEAARNSIVDQICSVFGAYGIEVDPRHLSLIADYMTYEGGFKPMNRAGMADISSPFLQMSFETTAQFMTEAALCERKESLMSPSANIVLGRPIRHGTGAFELLTKRIDRMAL